MNEKQQKEEVKEYAEGWISERKGTDVPGFLKAAYVTLMAWIQRDQANLALRI